MINLVFSSWFVVFLYLNHGIFEFLFDSNYRVLRALFSGCYVKDLLIKKKLQNYFWGVAIKLSPMPMFILSVVSTFESDFFNKKISL